MTLNLLFKCAKCDKTLGVYTGEDFTLTVEGKAETIQLVCEDCALEVISVKGREKLRQALKALRTEKCKPFIPTVTGE